MDELIITPKTKVLDLIEAYPDLEEILIETAPAFNKLKNPLLRKTVARITSLQQAAAVGDVPVEDLVNRLRKAAGQDLISGIREKIYQTAKPYWFSQDLIEGELDAREMLAAGEHPVNQIIADLKVLKPGKIYKLTAPFVPAPVIDKAASLQFDHWIEKVSEEKFNIYFIVKSA